MSRITNILKKVIKKGPQLLEGFQIKKAKNVLYYIKYNKEWKTELNTIFIESKNGEDLAGNILSILIELRTNPQYTGYEITVPFAQGKYKEFKQLFETYNLHNITLVPYCSKKYFELLTKSKYWINDSTFLANIIKKEDQIYLNTWHGTPWKCMGRPSESNRIELGNVQRNFLMSDYIIWPNQFMKEKMTEGYMLDKLCTKTKEIITGYPRNDFFLNPKPMELSKLLNKSTGTKFYMYLPTWRPDGDRTQEILTELDKKLKDNECLIVKLHPLQKGNLNIQSFKHIAEPPKGFGLYHILSHCDCLISDYSSVIFDYAHLNNSSIILYPYDKNKYCESRGLYIPLEEIGLPIVDSIDELYNKIQEAPQVNETFKQQFCDFNCKNRTRQITEHLLGYDRTKLTETLIGKNGKPNILIHSGNLDKNGVTTSLLNFVKYLDSTNRYNVIMTFKTNLAKPNSYVLEQIPKSVSYMPKRGQMNITLFEQLLLLQYPLLSWFPDKVRKIVIDHTENEFEKYYPGLEFDTVIQFTGYGYQELYQYQKVKAKNHLVFVHNDMIQEIKTRGNQHKEVLEYVYPKYDSVCLVSENLREATEHFSKSDKNFTEVLNLIDYEKIKKLGDMPIKFSTFEEGNTTPHMLQAMAKDYDCIFCTIGRYSKEKGHKRLIDAFREVERNNKDKKLALIIIGGCGEEYKNTVKYTDFVANIICLKGLRNPQPIIRQCSCFVLSSYYEGQPMVFAEADIQGLPVISTDIKGAHNLLTEYGGYLCEDSTEGLVKGMQEFLNGNIKPMNIDFEQYNNKAKKQIDKVLNYEKVELSN